MEINQLFLKDNPFRVVPATNYDEIIWAGFGALKLKIANKIKRAIQIPNSSLVLNWGEYGSGKTHAARYFQKINILEDLSQGYSLPLSFLLNFPKGKEPVKELFTQLIDKLDIDVIRKKLRDVNTQEALNNCTDNVLIQNVIRLLFDETISVTNMKSYLYGNSSINASFINNNVQRKLESDSDYTDFLAALCLFLTYQKKPYSCIIMWLDEFEDISLLNSSNINKMNNFIRSIMDKAPNNLLIFMNLTQSAMMDVVDLGEYLQESVKSRIKAKIELPIPNKFEVKEYLSDLLNNPIYRIEGKNGFFPFKEDVVDEIISDMGDSVSLRKYNEVFSSLLENALFDNQTEISINYYHDYKRENE